MSGLYRLRARGWVRLVVRAALSSLAGRTASLAALLLLVWLVLPPQSATTRRYCVGCGCVAAALLLFSGSLALLKKLPASRPVRGEHALGLVAFAWSWLGYRLRRAMNSRFRAWHNAAGVYCLPFALAHSGFVPTTPLTIALMISLVAVIGSGVGLATVRTWMPAAQKARLREWGLPLVADLLTALNARGLPFHRRVTVWLLLLLLAHIVAALRF